MIDELYVRLLCSNCGDKLDVERDMNALWHREHHGCFGGEVGIVATIDDDRITTAEGIRLEVNSP